MIWAGCMYTSDSQILLIGDGNDREMWLVLLECDHPLLRLLLHGTLWRGLRRMEAREDVRARAATRWQRRSLMIAGDIVITPGTDGPYHGLPALVLPKKGAYVEVWTGTYLLTYERAQLLPHGRVRRVKTYRTTKSNEFAQFRVNFGEEDFMVDVKITNELYKIEDLRKAAFSEALRRRRGGA